MYRKEKKKVVSNPTYSVEEISILSGDGVAKLRDDILDALARVDSEGRVERRQKIYSSKVGLSVLRGLSIKAPIAQEGWLCFL